MKPSGSFGTSFLLILLPFWNFLPEFATAATVQIDQDAYCQGENIQVSFDEVQGVGVWVGIYKQEDITDFTTLPGWDTEKLLGWILTCGERSEDGCDEWPSTGSVQLETDLLEDNQYVVVISEDRAALSAQAFTDPFQVTTCGPPITAPVQHAMTDIPTARDSDVAEAETSEPTASPTNPPAGVLVVDSSIMSIIQDARTQISDMIRADNDLIGKFLRLAFHDCVGGCDGCVDMTNPDHAGLAKPIEALSPIVDLFADHGLTRTDIWMLSALVATEIARPSDMTDINLDLHWIGRRTCEFFGDCGNNSQNMPTVCTEMLGPHREMCHAGAGTGTMLAFFENEFNFTPQQITAIMGAHSVGAMHRENSGQSGNWDLSSTSLDAGYWIELVGQPPIYVIEEIDNSDLPGIPNRKQWLGVINPSSTVVMLNTDIALIRNVPDMEDGIGCDFQTCSNDTPFMPHVEAYHADTRLFLTDFRDVLNLLIDHGHDKVGECPEGQVCTFGFGPLGADSAEALPVASPTDPPAISTPTFAAPGDGQPVLFLDKQCYNSGETIVASFENISGSGIRIGIFSADLVTDFSQLPSFDGDDVKQWVLSCGNTVCHTWLSSGGAQISTAKLDPGLYVAAISGTDGSSQGQAATNFQFGNC